MALVHNATLHPTKRELLNAWLPTRPWFPSAARVAKLRAYRFDDPEGEVGLEAFVLDVAEGVTVHVPLTYRDAPLSGSDEHLVGTSDHSVLGKRWIYDGCGDPAWAAALATAIRTGGTEATSYIEHEGQMVALESKVTVTGSGIGGASIAVPDSLRVEAEGPTTVVRFDGMTLLTVHIVGTTISADETLDGTWADGAETLAGLSQA